MERTVRISSKAAGLVLLVAVIGAHADAPGVGPDSDALASAATQRLEGTWIVTVTPPFSGLPFLAYTSYIRGGVAILSPDRLAPVPGLGTAIGNAQGSWRASGPRQFVATHVEFRYGSAGEVVGTAMVRSSARLTSDDTFEGQGQLVFCDAMLERCSPPGTALATVSGRRFRAEGPILP